MGRASWLFQALAGVGRCVLFSARYAIRSVRNRHRRAPRGAASRRGTARPSAVPGRVRPASAARLRRPAARMQPDARPTKNSPTRQCTKAWRGLDRWLTCGTSPSWYEDDIAACMPARTPSGEPAARGHCGAIAVTRITAARLRERRISSPAPRPVGSFWRRAVRGQRAAARSADGPGGQTCVAPLQRSSASVRMSLSMTAGCTKSSV